MIQNLREMATHSSPSLFAFYRNLEHMCPRSYDRVVSVGFMEHVGRFNFRKLYEIGNRLLKPDGLFLLHTMGINRSDYMVNSKWSHEFIFPNSEMPKLEVLALT